MPEFRIVVVDEFSALIDEMAALLPKAPVDLLDRAREFLDSGIGLVDSGTVHRDDGPASGAGDLRLVLKPSKGLLELAAAFRAMDLDVARQHGGTP
jgi:hypothetical protein